MDSPKGEEFFNNLAKASELYREILLALYQGKTKFFPQSFFDSDKIENISQKIMEGFFKDPSKFWELGFEYSTGLLKLVENVTEKFFDEKKKPLFYPDEKDKRFKDQAWDGNIFFDFVKQFYLMSSGIAKKSAGLLSEEPNLKRYLEFFTKQLTDAYSPSNFIFYNPRVLKESINSSFANIVKGLYNFLEDIKRSKDIFNITTNDSSKFLLGKNIAASEGKVVFRNELIELMAYAPKERTYSLPILLVPPCVNKYYILDLSKENSLVSFLVKKGFQVFTISWVNPDEGFRDEDFEDYVKSGVIDSCEFIISSGYEKLNALGYCIGGTMLACALSHLKERGMDYIAGATFLASLFDFSEKGDIGLLLDNFSLEALEGEVNRAGYFDGKYLSNLFSALRANDLIWSFFVDNYLLGKEPPHFDVLYWNSDPTNLPAKMYIYYLRNMYINDSLKIPRKLKIKGLPVDLSKIDAPSFSVGAKEDIISPWKSVYSGLKFIGGDKVFCLTDSGHVAGIVNPPGRGKYGYSIGKYEETSGDFLSRSDRAEGSWWEVWAKWLSCNSGETVPSSYGRMPFLGKAPGTYVFK